MQPKGALNTQIITLHSSGLTPLEVANALDLEPILVEAIIQGLAMKKRKRSINERFGKDVQDLVLATYINVMESSENDSARVRAAELMDGKLNGGAANEFNYEELAQALKEVDGIVAKSLSEKPANVLEMTG